MKVKHFVIVGALIASLGFGSIASAQTTSAHETEPSIHHSHDAIRSNDDEHSHRMNWLSDVANQLKMEPNALLDELKSGKSLAEVAQEKGVSVVDLKSGMESSLQKRLAEAVKSGKLSQDRADKIYEGFKEHIDQIIQHKGLMMRKGHSWMGEAAQILNMDPKMMWQELKSGKSLADLAKEKGMTEKQFKEKLLAAQKKRLDAAVKQGNLTKEKEQEIISRTKQHIDEWVTKDNFGSNNG